MPEPALSPGDVIRIQLEALRHNDEQDRGIAVAFRFASPANRANTGPLSRFTAMIKEGPYALMLDFRDATYDPGGDDIRPGSPACHADRYARTHDLLVLSVPAVGGALRGMLDDRCGVRRAARGAIPTNRPCSAMYDFFVPLPDLQGITRGRCFLDANVAHLRVGHACPHPVGIPFSRQAHEARVPVMFFYSCRYPDCSVLADCHEPVVEGPVMRSTQREAVPYVVWPALAPRFDVSRFQLRCCIVKT